MRIFFSVGEPSGDLHASNLIRHLRQQVPEIECVGFGGPRMEQAGCRVLFDLTSLAIMFFMDALRNWSTFRRLAREADDCFARESFDAVVLIDYPGFNWWIAKRARARGIPVYYYGVPQMWAWAPWRIGKLRRRVNHVLCKLPFEVDWFQKRNCQATYVGHPYFDQLADQQFDAEFERQVGLTGAEGGNANPPILLLLPGSRVREVERHTSILLRTAERVRKRQSVRVVVSCYNEAQQELAQQAARDAGFEVDQFEWCADRTPEWMRAATVCAACSGSVSLELLHYRVPTVIVYQVPRWVMLLQSVFLRVQYITLVNLIGASQIAKRGWGPVNPDAPGGEVAVMPEYLTTGDPSGRMERHLVRWLESPRDREANRQRLDELARQYARPGATARAADYLLQSLAASTGEEPGRVTRPIESREAA